MSRSLCCLPGVERVPKREVVKEAPAPRQEGSTTIYPLVEERLVVVKELVLREEICVTREITEGRLHDVGRSQSHR